MPLQTPGFRAAQEHANKMPALLETLFRQTVTSSERVLLKEYLHAAEKDMTQYEAEIEEHRAAIIMLETRRKKLQHIMGKCRSLLAPVHRMPPEILAQVFSVVCWQNAVEPNCMPPAIQLSFVCKRWRDIALSLPSLWASLSIHFERWKMNFERLERIVSVFMERSKSSPLSLVLDLTCSDWRQDAHASEMCTALLDTLVRNSNRWKMARLNVSTTGLCHPAFEPIIGHLPILKSLSLTGHDDADIITDNPVLDLDAIFGACPALDDLFVSAQMVVDGVSLPWRQIRSLGLGWFLHLEHFTLALAQCTNVESLHLNDIEFVEYPETPIHPGPTMPNVKHLNMEFDSSDDMFPVLRCLDLPALTSVRLQGQFNGSQYKTAELHLSSFLERSSNRITSLSLVTFPISDQNAISLLRMIPTLEQLYIEEEYRWKLNSNIKQRMITTEFWRSLSLIHATSSSHIVPRLKELELIFHGDDLNDGALLDTLTSRFTPDGGEVACLKKITLKIIGGVPSSQLKESLGSLTRHFGQKGTRLEVSYLEKGWINDY
ncbi:hypothetical protein VNI00_014355 [Paramarasmius palmivorus]|uniref:F-box domain-containing protein n=1 Tax=Paramarasmius palmivorus TaxID=297713 RepID=A0AAW0BTW0_9AGAR